MKVFSRLLALLRSWVSDHFGRSFLKRDADWDFGLSCLCAMRAGLEPDAIIGSWCRVCLHDIFFEELIVFKTSQNVLAWEVSM